MAADSDAITQLTAAVAIKLPNFWPDQPIVWYSQAEAQFAIKNITTSLTKFYHCVAVLPQDVAAAVIDLIRVPPPDSPYETLKERLLQTYSLSDYARAEQLVDQPPLGDRKPSSLLNSMLALLPEGHKPDFLFKFLFLRKLPADIRGHLINTKFEDIRDLAALADSLWSSRQTSPVSAATVSNPEEAADGSNVSALNRRSNLPSSYCWYHEKYGSQATKCKPGCSYKPSGNARAGRKH